MVQIEDLEVEPDLMRDGFPFKWLGVTWYLACADTVEVGLYSAAILAEHWPKVEEPADLSEDDQIEFARLVMSGCIMRGWDDLEDKDGNPIEFTKEKAYEILSNPRIPDALDRFTIASKGRQNFRLHLANGAAKN